MMFQGPAFVFLFLSVGAVALFGFLAVAAWSGTRAQERESYYKNDMLKKLAESDTQSAVATLQYLQEKERAREAKSQAKKREGYLVGGLVNMGVGIGLMVFLAGISNEKPTLGLVGLIPFLIGVALLISAYLAIPKKAD